MLPVVICESDPRLRMNWSEQLCALIRDQYAQIHPVIIPCSIHDLEHVVDGLRSIALVILSTYGSSQGDMDMYVRMARCVMRKNRDNYLIMSLKQADNIEMLLNRCIRPAGVLVSPIKKESMRITLNDVLNDFSSLKTGESQEYFLISYGKGAYRVAYRNLMYVEAQSKMLNLHMVDSTIVVRKTMDSLFRMLPDTFVRCHRSYIVNTDYITSVNIPEMLINIRDQAQIPISRSYKDKIRQKINKALVL